MMKPCNLFTVLILCLFLASCTTGREEISWKITDNPILTPWAESVDPLAPWPEYPRPDLKRERWINLNGLWEYAITPLENKPEKWDGKILVPFPVESALSGVKKNLGK